MVWEIHGPLGKYLAGKYAAIKIPGKFLAGKFLGVNRSFGRVNPVKVILEYSESKNIQLNVTGVDEKNAFVLACKNGRTEVVSLLLEHSSKIEMNVNYVLQLPTVSQNSQMRQLLENYLVENAKRQKCQGLLRKI